MIVRLVYGSKVNIRIPGGGWFHPFDGKKFARAIKRLEKIFGNRLDTLIESPSAEASPEMLAAVHTPAYLESLKHSEVIAKIVERRSLAWFAPSTLDRWILAPMRYAVAGTELGLRLAMEKKADVICHFGGGFHHAFPDHGEGFCVYNDIAAAIASLRKYGKITNETLVGIVDLDAHRGNGNEGFFLHDPTVEILDFYNFLAYPGDPDRDWADDPYTEPFKGYEADDKDYLGRLEKALPQFLDEMKPNVLFYIAGTDVIKGDRIGRLSLSAEGVLKRDMMVVDEAVRRGVPLIILTGGGYTHISHILIANTVAAIIQKSQAPSPPTSPARKSNA